MKLGLSDQGRERLKVQCNCKDLQLYFAQDSQNNLIFPPPAFNYVEQLVKCSLLKNKTFQNKL